MHLSIVRRPLCCTSYEEIASSQHAKRQGREILNLGRKERRGQLRISPTRIAARAVQFLRQGSIGAGEKLAKPVGC